MNCNFLSVFLSASLIFSVLSNAVDKFSLILVESKEMFPYEMVFVKDESHGIIDTFDVSEQGTVATKLHTQEINVYDDVRFSYSIKPSYTHCNSTVKWNENILTIYVATTNSHWDYQYFAIEVYGFEDFKVYSVPDTEQNQKNWDELSFYTKELEVNGKRYYLSDGNLLYNEHGSEGSFYIADSSFFHPGILAAPIAIPLCIYAFIKRKKLFRIEDYSDENH